MINVHWPLLIRGRASIIAIRDTTRDLRERVLDFTRPKTLSLGLFDLYPFGLTMAKDTIETHFQMVLEWLNGPDQSFKHNELRGLRGACTGMWLLRRKDYESWCEDTNSLFWIHGIREYAHLAKLPVFRTEYNYSWLWQNGSVVCALASYQEFY